MRRTKSHSSQLFVFHSRACALRNLTPVYCTLRSNQDHLGSNHFVMNYTEYCKVFFSTANTFPVLKVICIAIFNFQYWNWVVKVAVSKHEEWKLNYTLTLIGAWITRSGKLSKNTQATRLRCSCRAKRRKWCWFLKEKTVSLDIIFGQCVRLIKTCIIWCNN